MAKSMTEEVIASYTFGEEEAMIATLNEWPDSSGNLPACVVLNDANQFQVGRINMQTKPRFLKKN